MSVFERFHQGVARQEAGKGGGLERKLNGDYFRLISGMSRGQDKLMGKFKMAAGDVVNIRGQVLECMHIPTEIERELVIFGIDGEQKE
jgi:hypothetical protein